MKEIVTEETIKEITYIGNCPICGKEQKDKLKFKVDVECKNCRKDRFKRVIQYLESLGFDITMYSVNEFTELTFKFENVNYAINADSIMYIGD